MPRDRCRDRFGLDQEDVGVTADIQPVVFQTRRLRVTFGAHPQRQRRLIGSDRS
jgi:hypothetical protein